METDNNESAGPFSAIDVTQGSSKFLLCSIPAGELIKLCGGLTSAPSRSTSPDGSEVEIKEDVKSLVRNLESSAFSEEVNKVQAESYDEDDPYQRLLNRNRAKAISNYLQTEDALLPNGVILAANDGVTIKRDANNATISLEWDPSVVLQPLNIIDGQHRVEGLRLLVEEKAADVASAFSNFQVPATLLMDLPFYSQARLFATINGEQKKVNKSQIFDLLGYKPISDIALKEKAYSGEMVVLEFCHQVVKVLNTSKKSPWCGLIKMRGSGDGIVTQAAFIDHLAAITLPKKSRPGARYASVLASFVKDADLVGLARLLLVYFLGIKAAKPQFWASPEALSRSLFGKTNGIAVLFNILHDLICEAGGASKLTVEFVKQNWMKVSNAVIENPPRGGSKGYQKDVTASVLLEMFGENADKQIRASLLKVIEQLKSEDVFI